MNDTGTELNGTGLDRAPAEQVAAEIRKSGGMAIANFASVADFSAAGEIVDACIQEFGRIDVLVNCATIARGGQLWETSEEDSDAVLAVTLKGTLNTCHHALRAMMKQGTGRIINFASPSWLGVTGADAYTAAKGGVVSLTRGIASRMKLDGYKHHLQCHRSDSTHQADQDGRSHHVGPVIAGRDHRPADLRGLGRPRRPRTDPSDRAVPGDRPSGQRQRAGLRRLERPRRPLFGAERGSGNLQRRRLDARGTHEAVPQDSGPRIVAKSERGEEMLLSKKVAIITGGARGIGRAIAIRFAQEGCITVIADVRADEAAETLAQISSTGSEGLFVQCDVSASQQVQSMVDRVIKKFGRIDILVNDAAISPPERSFVDITEEQWDKVLAVNLKGVFLCCQAVVPHMKKQKYGKIVNVGSVGAIAPSKTIADYCVAKAAC